MAHGNFASPVEQGLIRKLWPGELPKLRTHLMRLDADSRKLRFGAAVDDAFIGAYASLIADIPGIVYGLFVAGELRAAAELRPIGDAWKDEAEAAFSVEAPYRDGGVGTELMGRVIRAARNRGLRRIYMNCLLQNRRMQRVARKFDASLRFDQGDVLGELSTIPNCFSLWREAMEDRMGFVIAVLDLQRRLLPAA